MREKKPEVAPLFLRVLAIAQELDKDSDGKDPRCEVLYAAVNALLEGMAPIRNNRD